MRLSYSLGSLLTVEEVLACSRKLNELKSDIVWIPETWGMENFSILSMVSKENTTSKIGSSIVNIYSRSPSLIAMGAVTVDTISNAGEMYFNSAHTASTVTVSSDLSVSHTFENPNEISVSVTASDFALSGDYKLLLGVYNSEVNISKYIDVIIEP